MSVQIFTHGIRKALPFCSRNIRIFLPVARGQDYRQSLGAVSIIFTGADLNDVGHYHERRAKRLTDNDFNVFQFNALPTDFDLSIRSARKDQFTMAVPIDQITRSVKSSSLAMSVQIPVNSR
jgi:hypothetical protein